MKTKRFVMKGLVAVALAAFIISGCKKKDDPQPDETHENHDQTELNNQVGKSEDYNTVDQQTNILLDDVNKILDNNKNTRAYDLPCHVQVDSLALMTEGLIKLTYNGFDCTKQFTRSGVISIQLPIDSVTKEPVRWTTKNANIIITIDNFKITRMLDNKTTTYNGKLTITNVNGGGVWALITGTPIIHKVRGGLKITFDDGSTREWAVARTRTYELDVDANKPSDGLIKVTDEGDTLINSKKVAYWGKNRADDEFYLSIDKPIITNIFGGQLCRLLKPYQGVITMSATVAGTTQDLVITLGVDDKGNPIGSADCPYGYKLSWKDATGTKEVVVKYY